MINNIKSISYGGLLIASGLLASTSVNAAVSVSDLGLTPPTIGANDTGITSPNTNSRFSFDVTPDETFTQTFTVPTAGNIQSIYLGYNAFLDTNSMTVDLTVNGTTFTGIFLDGADFSGSDGGNNNGFYWMEFDLSAEGVTAVTGAAANSFSMDATASVESGQGYAFAPRQYFQLGGGPNAANWDQYDGGALTTNFGTFDPLDLAFVVTVAPVVAIPEPSSMALLGLGAAGLLLRRRR